MPLAMPGSFPDNNKENVSDLPSVPHGMSNKKRHRVDLDDEKDPEEASRSPKKQKANTAEGEMLVAPRLMAKMKTPNSKLASPAKGKGILSMSRLNMLARPKVRK